jgi:hypothetical protein
MVALYILGESLEYLFEMRRLPQEIGMNHRLSAIVKPYAIVALLSFMATLITPQGIRLYMHIGRYLSNSRLLSLIEEFKSPDFHTPLGRLIEVLLLLSAISLYEIIRRRRFTEGLLLLLWLHLSLYAARNAALGMVIVIPIIARNITSLIDEARSRLTSDQSNRSWFLYALNDLHQGILAINKQLNGAIIHVAALLFIAITIYSAKEDIGWTKRILPSQFSENIFPSKAVEFIEGSLDDPRAEFHNKLHGNMFSTDYYGGYCIYRLYPKLKVFMDGRSDFYQQGGLVNDMLDILQMKPNVAMLLDRHKVQWLLIPQDAPLAAWAQVNANWMSIYQDKNTRIFIKK